ncbi:hypothetical protein I6N98_11940 [Spongiibacter nanhainus]|uniref:Uncharacterized protein n=1 Tax=Spongiibacter nanhainus TaxID=2794344 RepID=A0A7T4UPI3_9GAMM|nr:hypothetical protein [Spongiibacter nanhainus]QQD17078.1 hypothetical protein I6N98_11940 [Spongiibacter nanhainus]
MAGSFLTNKHVVVAMIIAPILAILAYFAVDSAVSEPPVKAVEGQSYELVAASNCRYKSGRCTLKNGNFKVELVPAFRSERVLKLQLQSEFPLEGAKVAIAPNASASYPPVDMDADSSDQRSWTLQTSLPQGEAPELRLVVVAEGSIYYGDTGLTFTEYQTSFGKDFRENGADD